MTLVLDETILSAGWRRVEQVFAARGRSPFQFQTDTWNAYLAGQSGMITVPTGGGKTLAAAIGPMIEAIDGGLTSISNNKKAQRNSLSHLKLLWITPLRALAADTAQALQGDRDGIEFAVVRRASHKRHVGDGAA